MKSYYTSKNKPGANGFFGNAASIGLFSFVGNSVGSLDFVGSTSVGTKMPAKGNTNLLQQYFVHLYKQDRDKSRIHQRM